MINTNNPIYPHHRLAKWAGVFLLTAVPLAYAHDGHDIVLYVKLLAAQIGTLFMTIAWFMGAVQGRISKEGSPLDLPILLFLLINALSWATMAINPFKSGLVLVKLFTFATLFFSVSRTFHFSFLKPWIYTLTITATLISIIGICQYLGLGFLWLRSVSGGYPSATFVLRNIAAMYLVIIIPIALLPFIFSSSLQSEIFWGSLSTLPVVFLIYTRTRGAWVGLGIALIISISIFLWRFPVWRSISKTSSILSKTKIFVAICCFLFVSYMAQLAPQAIQRTKTGYELPGYKSDAIQVALSIAQDKPNSRLTIWQYTFDLIQDHWIIGAGIGNWPLLYPQYAQGEYISPGHYFLRPHNDLLWILSETGLIGLITFLCFSISTFFYLFFLLQKFPFLEKKIVILCFITSLLAISGHSCFSFPLERITPLMFWSILPGIVASMCTNSHKKHFKNIIIHPLLKIISILLCLYITTQALKVDRIHYQLSRHRIHNNWDGVLDMSNKALTYGVFDHWFLFWQAQVYHLRGDLERARQALDLCLKYHPNEMTAHWKIGVIEREQGNLKAAIEAFKKASALDQDNPNFHQNLGSSYQLLGHIDTALVFYQKAQMHKSEDVFLYLNMGHIYQDQNQIEKALDAYKNVLKYATDPTLITQTQNTIEELNKTNPSIK